MSNSLARSLDRLPLAANTGAVRSLPHSLHAAKRGGSAGAGLVADRARAASPSRGGSAAGKAEFGRRLELLEACVASNWQEFSIERREMQSKLAELMVAALEPRERDTDYGVLCADLGRRLSRCEGLRDVEAAACQALSVQVSDLNVTLDFLHREFSDFRESSQVAATPRGAVRAVERTEANLNEEMTRLQGQAAQAAALAVESAKAATARSTAEGELSQIHSGAERDLERIRTEALGQAKAMVEKQWLQLQAKTVVPFEANVTAATAAPPEAQAKFETANRFTIAVATESPEAIAESLGGSSDKHCEMLLKTRSDTMQLVLDLEERMDNRVQSNHSEQIGALWAVESHVEISLQRMNVEMADRVKYLEGFAENVASHSNAELAVMNRLVEMTIEASTCACRTEVSDYLHAAGDRLERSWIRNREEATCSWDAVEAMVNDRLDASRTEAVECAEALVSNTNRVEQLRADMFSVLAQKARDVDVRLEEGLASQAFSFAERAQADGEKREEAKARMDALEGKSLKRVVSTELAELRAVVDEACATTAASARDQAQLAVALATAESARSEAKLVTTLDEALERLRADSALQASKVATEATEQVQQIMRANEEKVVSLAASAQCLQDELSWLQQDVSAINDCQGDAQNRVDGAITALTDCLAEEVRETQRLLVVEETAVASEHRAMRQELQEQGRTLARLESDGAVLVGPRETLCRRLFPAEEDGRIDELFSTVQRLAEESGRDSERCEIWARCAHRELLSEHSALSLEVSEHARSLVGFESRAEETSRAAEANCAQVAELSAAVERIVQRAWHNEVAPDNHQSEAVQHRLRARGMQRPLSADALQPSLERSLAPVEDIATQARAIDDDEVFELASVLEQLSRETRQRGDRVEPCRHSARPGAFEMPLETRPLVGVHTTSAPRFPEDSHAQMFAGICPNMPWQEMRDIQGALGRLQTLNSPRPLRIPAAH